MRKTQQKQQKEGTNRQIAVYWATFLHNKKKDDDMERTRKWVARTKEMMRKTREATRNQEGCLKLVPMPIEV